MAGTRTSLRTSRLHLGKTKNLERIQCGGILLEAAEATYFVQYRLPGEMECCRNTRRRGLGTAETLGEADGEADGEDLEAVETLCDVNCRF